MSENTYAGTTDVLGAIAEISGQVVGPFEADELYDRVVETVTRLSSAAAGSLWLIDNDGVVRIKAARGYHKNLIDCPVPNPQKLPIPAEYRLGEGVTGSIAQKGEVVRTKHGTPHRRAHPEWRGKYDSLQWPEGGDCVSFLGVPLRLPSGIIGLLKVENRTSAASDQPALEFSEQDEDMMRTLANVIAVTIENNRISSDRAMTVRRIFQLHLQALAHRARGLLGSCQAEFRASGAILAQLREVHGHLTSEARRQLTALFSRAETTVEALSELYDVYVRWFGDTDEPAAVRPCEALDHAVTDTNDLIQAMRSPARLPVILRDPPEDEACVRMRRSILRYVLHELIYNAAKSRATKLLFRVRPQESTTTVRIDLVDNGPGLSPERREAFERGSVRDSLGTGHGGLGLDLCRRLLQGERGDLRFLASPTDSNDEFMGAHFVLTLPATQS